MFSVCAADVLHAKIVDNKGEGDRPGGVAPQARGQGGRGVTVRCKEGSETVGQFARLVGESVHAFADLNVDVVTMDKKGKEIVVGHDQHGNDGNGNAHVLTIGHRGLKVKIFEIACHESAARCGDDTVE